MAYQNSYVGSDLAPEIDDLVVIAQKLMTSQSPRQRKAHAAGCLYNEEDRQAESGIVDEHLLDTSIHRLPKALRDDLTGVETVVDSTARVQRVI